ELRGIAEVRGHGDAARLVVAAVRDLEVLERLETRVDEQFVHRAIEPRPLEEPRREAAAALQAPQRIRAARVAGEADQHLGALAPRGARPAGVRSPGYWSSSHRIDRCSSGDIQNDQRLRAILAYRGTGTWPVRSRTSVCLSAPAYRARVSSTRRCARTCGARA